MAATFTASATFKAVDKVSKVMRSMTKASSSFAAKTEAAFARVERASNRMQRKTNEALGTIGKIGLGFSAFELVRSGTTAVLDFESALVGVGKTTGIENENLKKLGAQIVNTSNQLKTVKTNKLLELSEAAGQLGVKGTDNIITFSKTMAKLEKSSDIVGEEGAKSIARLLTITKEGVGVVDQFAASLVALGNSSAASESEILSVASEVGRATAAYALNTQEILGISASLKSLDVAPEAAGSAIGKVFRAIDMATLRGGQSLENFAKVMKLTPEQVKETFKKSPQEAFSFFVKGLGRINKEGGSVAKALMDVGLSGEMVSKGIIPLAVNYKLLEEKQKLAIKAFKENTALDKEFAASQKTIKSAINSIVRAYENLFIKQAAAGSRMEIVQNILFGIADNMGTILTVIGLLIASFVAFKAVMILVKTAIIANNVVMGISAAIAGKSAFAVHGNTVAYGAFRVAVLIAAAAQKVFNAVMSINPISLVIIAIIALVGIVQSFRRNWELVVAAFENGGILKGLLSIGKVLLDAILMPVQQLLELIGKIPGLDIATTGAEKIAALREGLFDQERQLAGQGVKQDLQTSKAVSAQESIKREERITTNSATLNIKNNTGMDASIETTENFPIQFSTTN